MAFVGKLFFFFKNGDTVKVGPQAGMMPDAHFMMNLPKNVTTYERIKKLNPANLVGYLNIMKISMNSLVQTANSFIYLLKYIINRNF